MPKKKRTSGPSGPNIPEEQRGTKAIKLRLRPEIADALRDLAGDDGVSAWVTEIVKRRMR